MADNLSQKSPKAGEKTKVNSVLTRINSDVDKNLTTSAASPVTTPSQRKKTPAFQITSVTVLPSISADGGEDSADDLDESHTDDTSDVVDNSRITDIENETPSFSEDTFSKEDVFFNATAASLGSAPVIPTSSQYGLAIVANEAGSATSNNGSVPTSNAAANTTGDVKAGATDSTIAVSNSNSVNKQEAEMRDVHAPASRNERFKVVKIESTVPFKRGRWMCMDYLDHTMSQNQQNSQQAIINVVKNVDGETNTSSVKYGTDSGVVITDGLIVRSIDSQGITSQDSSKSVFVNEQQQQQQPPPAGYMTQQGTTGNFTPGQSVNISLSPGQTLQQPYVSTSQQNNTLIAQVPQQNLQQQQPQQQPPMLQHQMSVIAQQQLQQQHPTQVPAQNVPMHHTQSMSQVPMQHNVIPGQHQQSAQHQSLPPQQFQQVISTANSQYIHQQQNLPAGQQVHQPQNITANQQMYHQSLPPASSQQQISQAAYIPPPTQPVQQQQQVPTGLITVQQGLPQQIIVQQQPPQQQQQQQMQATYYTPPPQGVSAQATQQGVITMGQVQQGVNVVSQPPSVVSQPSIIQTSAASQTKVPVQGQQQPQTIPLSQPSATQQVSNSVPMSAPVISQKAHLPPIQIVNSQIPPSQDQVQQHIPVSPQPQLQPQQQIPLQPQVPVQQQQMPPNQQHIPQIHQQQIINQQITPQQQPPVHSSNLQPVQQQVHNIQQPQQQQPPQQPTSQQQQPLPQQPPPSQQQQGQQPASVMGQQPMIPVQTSVPMSTITGPAQQMYSNSATPAQSYTNPQPVTVTAARTPVNPVLQHQASVSGVGATNISVASNLPNVVDPNSGAVIGIVSNPAENQISQPEINAAKTESHEIGKNAEEKQTAIAPVEDQESVNALAVAVALAPKRPRELVPDAGAAGAALGARGPPPNTPLSRAASPVPPADAPAADKQQQHRYVVNSATQNLNAGR